MKLLTKQILITATLMVVLALGASFASGKFLEIQLVKEVDRAAFLELSDEAGAMERFFNSAFAEVDALAAHPAMRRPPTGGLQPFLQRELERNTNVFENLYFSRLDGAVIDSRGRTTSIKDRPIHQYVLKGKASATRILAGQAAGERIIYYVSPVFDPAGRLQGALGASLHVDKLVQRIDKLRVGVNGSAILLDEKGVYLSSQIQLRDQERKLLAGLVAHPDSSGKGHLNLAGISYIVYARTIPRANWTLCVIRPESEVSGPAVKARSLALGLIAVALPLGIALLTWATRLSLQPLSGLMEAIRVFGEGNRNARAAVRGKDELAEISRQFNRMAGLIQDQEKAQNATSAELAASERNLRMVLNSTHDAFLVLCPDGKVLNMNSVARAMFGVPEQSAVEGTLHEWLNLGEPSRDFLERQLKQKDGFGSGSFSLRAPARGGLLEMQLEGTVRPVHWHERDALLVIFRDVTRQQATQEQLRESERRYRTLFENATDAILLVEEGRVTDCNFKAIQLLGAGRSEIIGQTLASLSPAVLPNGTAVTEALTQIEESLELTGLAVQEWVFRRAKGAPVTVELKMVRTRLEGKPLTEVIATDITARLQLEEQLRQAQKLEAVGKLAGGVAHDFNNLLTIIDSNLWLLDQNFPAETAEGELLKDIRGASDRAAELTRQLLAFSRRQIIQARAVDLGHLLTNLEKMVGRMAGEQVNCQVVAKPGTPLIQADPGMIEQIVINLAVNARDAMAAGGKLTISCEGKEVGFDEVNPGTDARPGLFAKLSIVDNGCGMDEATAKRIFEPFFTTKEFGKGTGLGLAMVYGIIKQHRGWVEVESHPGKGTAFHIYLPAVKALPLDAVEPHPPQRGVGGEIVLLVEDEAPLRQAVHTALSRFGYRVLSAGNASDARRLWKEYPGKIDVLVTDLVMPGSTNGSELALQLQGEAPRLKAILMSGYSEEFSRRGAESSPNTAFLQKPFSPSDLAALIRSLLDGNSAKS